MDSYYTEREERANRVVHTQVCAHVRTLHGHTVQCMFYAQLYGVITWINNINSYLWIERSD